LLLGDDGFLSDDEGDFEYARPGLLILTGANSGVHRASFAVNVLREEGRTIEDAADEEGSLVCSSWLNTCCPALFIGGMDVADRVEQ